MILLGGWYVWYVPSFKHIKLQAATKMLYWYLFVIIILPSCTKKNNGGMRLKASETTNWNQNQRRKWRRSKRDEKILRFQFIAHIRMWLKTMFMVLLHMMMDLIFNYHLFWHFSMFTILFNDGFSLIELLFFVAVAISGLLIFDGPEKWLLSQIHCQNE